MSHDPVNHPQHYTSHPSGVECIQVTEHMGFNLGNAVKYIWRADLKGAAIEDLEKAAWYVQREIEKRRNAVRTADAMSFGIVGVLTGSKYACEVLVGCGVTYGGSTQAALAPQPASEIAPSDAAYYLARQAVRDVRRTLDGNHGIAMRRVMAAERVAPVAHEYLLAHFFQLDRECALEEQAAGFRQPDVALQADNESRN